MNPSNFDPTSHRDRREWLRLIRTPKVGPVLFWKLLNKYGSPAEVLAVLPRLKRDLSPPPLERVEDEIDASDRLGVRLLFPPDPDYPPLLRELDPVPPVLSGWGDLSLAAKPCIGIVGSRNASAIGQKFACQIAFELGEAGVTIVSGLARGIDAAAHEGALNTGTIGVLGGGVDHIYPRQNHELHLNMRERGLLVSESPLGYRATARDFPRRNRLISGLSRGIVVVEAAEKSGTLITARYAMEQNREVMAAPGSPLDPRTKGCNRLIRDGAALIETAQDILDILESLPAIDLFTPQARADLDQANDKNPAKETSRAFQNKTERESPRTKPRAWESQDATHEAARDPAEQILAHISFTPTPRDDVIRASGLATSAATAALMELQMRGDILVEADGQISKNSA